jgi:hypothetical protein
VKSLSRQNRVLAGIRLREVRPAQPFYHLNRTRPSLPSHLRGGAGADHEDQTCAFRFSWCIREERELLAHPKCGASWEGYAIERVLDAARPDEAYFWATHQGAELDLLIFKDGRRLGIEIKRPDAPQLTPSMRIAMEDRRLDSLVVLYPGHGALCARRPNRGRATHGSRRGSEWSLPQSSRREAASGSFEQVTAMGEISERSVEEAIERALLALGPHT